MIINLVKVNEFKIKRNFRLLSQFLSRVGAVGTRKRYSSPLVNRAIDRERFNDFNVSLKSFNWKRIKSSKRTFVTKRRRTDEY